MTGSHELLGYFDFAALLLVSAETTARPILRCENLLCQFATCCAIRSTRVRSLLLLLSPRPVYIGIPKQLQGSRLAIDVYVAAAAALIYC